MLERKRMRSLESVNKELHILQEIFVVKIFWTITSRMRWTGYVECMARKTNLWSVLVKDHERMKEV